MAPKLQQLRPAGCVLLALALPALLVALIRPTEIDPAEIERSLGARMGAAVEVDAAERHLLPWPALELHHAETSVPGPWSWPLGARVRRMVYRGRFLGWDPAPEGGGDVFLEGIELHCGPLDLVGGRVEVEKHGRRMHVKGRALGRWGGSLELRATLGGEAGPRAAEIQLYLAQLELALLRPLLGERASRRGALELSGLVTLTGSPDADQRLAVDLTARAPRAEGMGHWLQTHIDGALQLREGRFESGERLHARAEVRSLGAGGDRRTIHGPVELWVELIGDWDSGELRLEADLTQLRVRAGRWFDKPAGAAGRLRYHGRWMDGGMRSGRGDLELGDLTVRLERSGSGGVAGWRLHAPRLPLESLREYVPTLRGIAPGSATSLALEATWDAEAGLNGRLVLRDLRVPTGAWPVELPFARIDIGPDVLRAEIPELRLAGQRLDLVGSLEWIPTAGRLRLATRVHADEIDLDPLAELVRAPGGRDGSKEGRTGAAWTAPVRDLLRRVRADPRTLTRLQIEPAIVEVGHLHGLGLDFSDTRFRLRLEDQRLELERSSLVSREGARHFVLDLNGWLPRLTASD
ncbi:MAG: hypothetical protein ACE5FG_10075 [Myxococcota bacterium]